VRARSFLAALLALTLPSSAVAASIDPACTSVARIASDIWKAYDEATRAAGCLVPWRGPRRNVACLIEASKIPYKIADQMVGHWNTRAAGEWQTIGPRRIEAGANEGTLVSPTNRLFVGSVPVHTEELSISVEKRDGHGSARVTVCATSRDGGSRVLWKKKISGGPDNIGMIYLRTWPDVEGAVISVKLDGEGFPGTRFAYTLRMEERPWRDDTGPVTGFADLHNHQMARLAHAGLWFWGDHAEPLEFCRPTDHAIPTGGGGLGIFHGPPLPFQASSWPRWDDVAHQQVHADWLRDAHVRGLNLVVVSAVNFEPFCSALRLLYPNRNPRWGCRDMENVKRQLQAAIDFDLAHDWYEIAVTPWHARQIIHDGNLAVVLSLEASNLLPRNDGDVVAQLEELRGMGLRTLQLAHETDSRLAGAAPHMKLFELLAEAKPQLTWTGVSSGFNLDSEGKNRQGLTAEGRRLLEAMMDRNMLIDLAHLSESSVRDVYEVARARTYYPLYNSHTRFKAVMTEEDQARQREFLSTCEQVAYIERTGGMVGLRTGQNEMKTVGFLPSRAPRVPSVASPPMARAPVLDERPAGPVPEALLAHREAPVENDCPGSSRSFAQMLSFGSAFTSVGIAFGSDFNGFIEQVGPRLGAHACHMEDDPGLVARGRGAQRKPDSRVRPAFNEIGLSHVGLLPDLLFDLEAVGADTERLASSAEAFLRMWERTYETDRKALPVFASCGEWERAITSGRVR
jgi:microsomal dipeptidase-like Zn-dependent dipeptidase